MKRLFATSALLATTLSANAAWVQDGNSFGGNALAMTVKKVQYYTPSGVTGYVKVIFQEYPTVTFRQQFSTESTVAMQQANAHYAMLLTAKATGGKLCVNVPSPGQYLYNPSNPTAQTTFDFDALEIE